MDAVVMGLRVKSDLAHRQGELLLQLAEEAAFGGLARFPLASGELPQMGVFAAFAPLADQDHILKICASGNGNGIILLGKIVYRIEETVGHTLHFLYGDIPGQL